MRFFEPEVFMSPIYFPRNGHPPFLRYVHCVDIVRFKGKYIAAWNANTKGAENVPGQYNFISFSDDFVNWTPPEKMFAGKNCLNPIPSDNQWQPSFLNWRDEKLFCFWCDVQKTFSTYLSESTDGVHWRNRRLDVPDINGSKMVAFPTNHGLAAKDGALYCPVNFVTEGDLLLGAIGYTRYAGALISHDGGGRWEWTRNYAEAVPWAELGYREEEIPDFQPVRPFLWEPMLYEEADGRLGMLVRNAANHRKMPAFQPHHTLLHATSEDGGISWSRCRPVEQDSVVSRNFAVSGFNGGSAMLMCMNDWPSGVPDFTDQDRYALSLYFAPVSDPDLLLPGPLLQPPCGRGFYPNGFVEDHQLFVGYSYQECLFSCRMKSLPKFSEPFLLYRESRQGVRIGEEDFSLQKPESTVGLVLTEELTRTASLHLGFDFVECYRSEEVFPLLTLGGKTRNGAVICFAFDPAENCDRMVVKMAEKGEAFELAHIEMRRRYHLDVTLDQEGFSVALNGAAKVRSKGRILRKIAFGGLYVPPEWGISVPYHDEVRILTTSITVQPETDRK